MIQLNVEDITDDATKAILKEIREAIPTPTSDTLMQKVVSAEDLNKILSGVWAPTIGGFVTRAQDTKNLKNYADIREGLRLDYTLDNGTIPFPEGGNEIGIIRFKTDAQIDIPYSKELGGTSEIWENSYGRQPFTGNGFTKSNNTIIPEYTINGRVTALDGAEVYKIIDGVETKVADIINGSIVPVN